LIAKSPRWQRTAIATAAVAILALSGSGAWALSLGRITVQSALGEPLRAEIDVPDINAEEAASLRTVVAAPAAFVAAGMEYNPVMPGLQMTLQRRADGRAFIRLGSNRPINDPFVDMILEASWSSGRIVRDYTMLFDPPAMRQPSPTIPTLPQVSAPQPAASTTAVGVAETPRSGSASKPAVSSLSAPAKATPNADAVGDKQVVVKSGDTASKIAANIKSPGISLDQMLVAMMRSSPSAFIDNNVNRIRAGAVVNVPTSEQAQSVTAGEASRILATQSKDFNAFRRNLASNAPAATVAAADRKASGSIQTKVEEKKATGATPDKLTLTKGAIQAQPNDKANETKLAKERAEKDAAAREAEIAKNISDLKKAGAAIATAPATAPASAPATLAAPAVAVARPPASAPAPVAATAKPVASAPVKAAATAAPVPAEDPGLLDDLLEDPLIPAAGAGLLAMLGGFAFYKIRQRKKKSAQVDSAFLESRLQPDSFFGASGGQRVDTANDGPASASSMVYPASQLDAADDVDPVAEADVYMAYGRDVQAEEILKEALRTSPGRLAIHTKLLEIFSKRRDTKSFETTATQAYKLTGANNPEWTRICEMGLTIDPDNAMYQPGGTPSQDGGTGSGPSEAAFGQTVSQPSHAALEHAPASVDLDLDLDFSLDDEPASAISDVTGGRMIDHHGDQTVKMEVPHLDAMSEEATNALDFDVSGPGELKAAPDQLPEISISMDGLSLSSEDPLQMPDFEPTGTMPSRPVAPPAPAQNDAGMLEFDMGSLSLDLDPPKPSLEESSAAPDSTSEDPLETKLALAEEFVSIGDEDGARALIEEVVAEANGEMRAKAQRALANLS